MVLLRTRVGMLSLLPCTNVLQFLLHQQCCCCHLSVSEVACTHVRRRLHESRLQAQDWGTSESRHVGARRVPRCL